VSLKQPTKRPYDSTKVTPEQTKAEIEKLLKDYGIKDIQWTTYRGETELKFIWHITVRGAEKEITFAFKPPIILVPRRTWNTKLSRYEKVNVPHEAMAMRLLWHYLKAKLEAISWGLETIEKEFMSHIKIALPTGQETTLGEIVTLDNLQKALTQTALALEYKPEETAPGTS